MLNPGDNILGLDLPSGGHLSHGYQTEKKKVSAISSYFNTSAYKIRETDQLIHMQDVEEMADASKPKLIIVGGSAYPRD